MPLYEPLRDTLRSMRDSFMELDRVNRQEALTRERQNMQHQENMMTIQMQRDEMERMQIARSQFGQALQGMLGQDPYKDRVSRVDQISKELPQLQAQAKSIKNDRRFAKEHLLTQQNISALTSEQARLQAELNDSSTMINEYLAKASAADQLALQVAQYDPSMAQLALGIGDNARGQANTLTQIMNSQKETKKKGKIVEVYDSDGNILRVEELFPGKPLVLGPGESTRYEKPEKDTSQHIRFYDPEDEYREVGSEMVGKTPGKGMLNASKQRVAKAAGIEDWKRLVTEIPQAWLENQKKKGTAGPKETGFYNEKQAKDNLTAPFMKRDLEGNMLGVNEGLEDKVQVLEQMFDVEAPKTAAARTDTVARIRGLIKRMETAYWKRYDEIEAADLTDEQKKAEYDKIINEWRNDMSTLTSKKDPSGNAALDIPGIYYTPNAKTRANLKASK